MFNVDVWSFLSPVYGGIVSLLLGFVIGKLQKAKNESSAMKTALGALLRNDMFEIYKRYRDGEEVPADVQEEMHSLYMAYHGLGFNNLGTKIHDEIMDKKTKV